MAVVAKRLIYSGLISRSSTSKTRVVHLHAVFGRRLFTIAFFQDFILQAGFRGFDAVAFGILREELFPGFLIFLRQFFRLGRLLLLELSLVGHQGFLDFLTAHSRLFFVAVVAVLNALEELLHLKVRQVVAHSLAHDQAHAVADFLIRGFQRRIFRNRFLGRRTACHDTGHRQCDQGFSHYIVLS